MAGCWHSLLFLCVSKLRRTKFYVVLHAVFQFIIKYAYNRGKRDREWIWWTNMHTIMSLSLSFWWCSSTMRWRYCFLPLNSMIFVIKSNAFVYSKFKAKFDLSETIPQHLMAFFVSFNCRKNSKSKIYCFSSFSTLTDKSTITIKTTFCLIKVLTMWVV